MLKADAGKVFMIGIYGKELNKETREILDEIKPGFVILFSRNVDTLEQVKKLVDDVSDFLGYRPIFAVDQEGGSVLRLKDGFSTLPSAMACAATGDTQLVKQAVNAMSLELKAVGIDFNLAPVVDINTDPFNPVIGIRSYSDDADVVVEFASSFLEGSKSARIMTCLKHFPGLGDVSVDPHYDLPVIEKSYDELYNFDLVPFRVLNANALMPSHVYLPTIQKDGLPASLSKEIISGIARESLIFKDLIVSDDLLMGGVSGFSIEDRIRLAFDAGNDVLVVCHEPDLQLRAFKYFKKMIKEDQIIKNKFTKLLERIMPLIHDVQHEDRPSMDLINCQEHRQIMKTVAEKSITVVRQEKLELPLRTLDTILTMVSPPFSPVSDNPENKIPSIVLEVAKQLGVNYSWFSEKNLPSAQGLKGKSIILFTYDAYRSDVLRKFIKELDNRSNLFLVALRNPYDALLVKNSLATYGSLDIQQKAITDVLTGRIKPTGTLPLKRREVVL
ncbi:beta-N-acetylhexosaminidase [Fervidobacterium sp.]